MTHAGSGHGHVAPDGSGLGHVTPEGSGHAREALAKQLIDAGRVGAQPTDAFEGMDLSGLDLSNQLLAGLRLRGSNLKKTKFYNAVLYCCDLRETDLSLADFRRSQILSCSLAGAKVTGARFCRMKAAHSLFHGLWWFEKMFVLQGGYTLCGAVPMNVDDLQPSSAEESHFGPPLPSPPGSVWDFSESWDGLIDGRHRTEAEAAIDDQKDEAVFEHFCRRSGGIAYAGIADER